ncbi:MAG: DUF4058 family protein [Gemmataceae bacterium]|nr:DUF4058 family protein [Gemmataceae bacterium]
MPMHDWARVEPTIFHHFHQQWSAEICKALNAGLLPPGLSALIEQHTGGVVPDVLAVERRGPRKPRPGGTATVPRTRMRVETQGQTLLRRANRVAIRHRLGEVVCIIEIVSPGNKASRSAVRSFVEKTHEFLRAGVNVLLVDPFPPGPRDPHSLHKLIWDEVDDVPFEMPAGEPLLLAAYRVGDESVGQTPVAFLEPFAVGAALTEMPAWIDPDSFVGVPLEDTYQAAWAVCPPDYRHLVEHGRLPDE